MAKVDVQHVHKALRHLGKHDNTEGNSFHLDEATKILSKSKSRNAVLTAIGHINRHDYTEGNSDHVDEAVKALHRSIGKG